MVLKKAEARSLLNSFSRPRKKKLSGLSSTNITLLFFKQVNTLLLYTVGGICTSSFGAKEKAILMMINEPVLHKNNLRIEQLKVFWVALSLKGPSLARMWNGTLEVDEDVETVTEEAAKVWQHRGLKVNLSLRGNRSTESRQGGGKQGRNKCTSLRVICEPCNKC